MENFRIESLEINKIGAFEHIKMDFPKKTDPDKAEIHILTGENGTGKSTVLMLLTGVADNSNEKELFKRINGNPENPSIYTIRYGGIKKMTRLIMTAHYTPPDSIQTSETHNSLTPVNYAFFAYSTNRFIGSYSTTIIENQSSNPFKDALKFDKTEESGNFLNWILTTKTRALVAKDKSDINESKLYIQSIKEIENALSGIMEQTIKFVLGSKPTLYLAIKVDETELNIDVLPDGIKSTLIWLGDLLMRLENISWIDNTKISLHQNFILFLDEIEVHLHPAWQRKILPVVQKLFKNAQIFISTYSPFVVGSVDGAWVHKLKKVGAYAVLDGEPILSEDAESYDTILEEIFGVKERFGDEIEEKLNMFREITKEILKGDERRLEEWDDTISFFRSQKRPDEIMSLITPQIRQINRIRNQVVA
jgi:predicted ATPase